MKIRATDNKGQNLNDALVDKDGNDRSTLPDFDVSVTTKYACVGAIVFGTFACLACFVTSITIIVAWKSRSDGTVPLIIGFFVPLSTGAIEVLALAVNFILTLCLESLAFVHATSLRWALYRENRLHFNTDLRLLTSAKSSGPNKWYINVISAACLILCYVATSQIFMAADEKSPVGFADAVLINPVALLVLGTCLFCYVVIAIWAVKWNHRHVPTWGSVPITTALAALHKHLTYHENRCLMPVHSALLPSGPTFPTYRQLSLLSALPHLFYLTIFIWALTFLSLVWWLSIVLVSRSIIVNHHHFIHWHFTMAWNPDYLNSESDAFNSVPIYIFRSTWEGGSHLNISQYIVAIIFITAIQGLQTIGLHCIELVVNANRDEDIWRCAAVFSPKKRVSLSSHIGMPRKLNPITSTLRS